MTDNRDELLVQRFFEENAIEVEDRGFTKRVMRRLPDRASRLSRIWTAICAVIAVVLVVKANAIAVLTSIFGDVVGGLVEQYLPSLNLPIIFLSLTALLFVGGCGAIMKDNFNPLN